MSRTTRPPATVVFVIGHIRHAGSRTQEVA